MERRERARLIGLRATLRWLRTGKKEAALASARTGGHSPRQVPAPVEIAPSDPLVPYLLAANSAVELEPLRLDSPAVRGLRAAGVRLVVPLISQGELLGMLNLGARRSQQEYSADDRAVLTTLAAQAAPAVQVAGLVRQRQAEVRARERLDHELRLARQIQQTLLPRELPALPGWQLDAYYRPARAVGGDFYDFLVYDDGRLGIAIGDVSDKGVPAALMMATTRSILRSVARDCESPGQVLQRANDLLCPDMPAKMFVTCLYGILDPASGQLRFANAGHDLPYLRHGDEVLELRARGMPLGLLPEMTYEEHEVTLTPGDRVLFHSDGLAEAHNPAHELFGFPRLMTVVRDCPLGRPLIEEALEKLADFTGADWEQEDDVTLVTLEHAPGVGRSSIATATPTGSEGRRIVDDGAWREVETWAVPSAPGNERQVMEHVGELVRPYGLPATRLENLQTAVAEATMNAMEHGNGYDPEKAVHIAVLASPVAILVRIQDEGAGQTIPPAETPDLAAKLAGEQSPRGWGLFLIEHLVDEMRTTTDETSHTIELLMLLPNQAPDEAAGAEEPSRD
jgi:serine phosphatase RsbU (regulator of sigma subunit)/anti-sigma regulatory factor (Ser/Thr protein kinase)